METLYEGLGVAIAFIGFGIFLYLLSKALH